MNKSTGGAYIQLTRMGWGDVHLMGNHFEEIYGVSSNYYYKKWGMDLSILNENGEIFRKLSRKLLLQDKINYLDVNDYLPLYKQMLIEYKISKIPLLQDKIDYLDVNDYLPSFKRLLIDQQISENLSLLKLIK